jgi:hypothetical protein
MVVFFINKIIQKTLKNGIPCHIQTLLLSAAIQVKSEYTPKINLQFYCRQKFDPWRILATNNF